MRWMMRKYVDEWREWNWRYMLAGGLLVLALVLCWLGWRGRHQQNATATLQDVYQEAGTHASDKSRKKIFQISFQEEDACRIEYAGVELSEAQFARVERSVGQLVERQAAVIEEEGTIQVGERQHDAGIYEERDRKDVHVYQMKGRSRFYLLVEDAEAEEAYLARLQDSNGIIGMDIGIGGYFRNYMQIRGVGDIRKVTLEDTKIIKPGQFNILAVYTEEREKKILYDQLCGIPLKEYASEEELLRSAYGRVPEDREMGKEGYCIEVENRQGETSLWRYQKTEKVDYLLMCGVRKIAVPVPEEQGKFWREVFDRNARTDDGVVLEEVMDYSEKEISWAQFFYPEECFGDSEVMDFSLSTADVRKEVKGTDFEDDLEYQSYLELYDMFLRAGVGKELSEERVKKEKTGKMKGMCCLYQDAEEDDSTDPMVLQIVWYSDVVKIQDNRDYPVVKKYYRLTQEMEELFERGEGYARDAYQSLKGYGQSEILEEKPVIYLYPEKMRDIHVEVENVDFTTVYPAYDGGWHVRARRDGTLQMYQRDGKTLEEGREYYALYYEGKSDLKEDWKRGFTVEKRDYREFLEEKLRVLGLSDREAEEFILYWLPRMERYDSVDVHFVEQSLLDERVPLRISPKPDTVIRVFMQWREHEEGKNIPREQTLLPVARRGYVGVEWGGSQVARD